MDGEIATFCNKSINDITFITRQLGYAQLLPNEDSEEEYEADEEYKKFISRRNEIKLPSFHENDIIGLNDSLVNGKYIYTAKCTSTQATVYEIHINFFKMMLALDMEIKKNVERYENVKRNLMIKLMLKCKKSKNDFYSYYDKGNEVNRFGCIKFKKGEKNTLQDFLAKRNTKTKSSRNTKKISNCKFHLKTNSLKPSNHMIQLSCLTHYTKLANLTDENLYIVNTEASFNKAMPKISFPKKLQIHSVKNTIKAIKEKRKMLLPHHEEKIFNATKTRRLLTEELPSFFYSDVNKSNTVFNMTNKILYKNVIKKY